MTTRVNQHRLKAALRRVEKVEETTAELKFVDYERTEANIGTSIVFIDPTLEQTISGIAQGDGQSERIGRTVAYVSLHIRGRITYTPTTSSQVVPSVRICCLLDRQTNQSRASVADIFSVSANPFTSFQNLTYESRFTILRDQELVLAPFANGGSSEPMDAVHNFTMNIRLDRNPITLYTGTSNRVVDMTNNSIHLLLLPSADRIGYSYTSRLRYVG